ncbi:MULTISPECIES: hypothetical protein [Persicobacter]|uniref:FeoB-associated Cys-rich membrane protein n=1 Tax=Persicobacter diffluens TaxID=981 RepID=A0AAN4VZI7_9BACT|nr:hypothetical protein [Persicobacter sp. CCB-QB2]GJM61818.1 hypothetical protein PEDI_23700 [Persicobacter diffluens]
MFTSFIISSAAIIGMMFCWLAIQHFWKRFFATPETADALEARGRCAGCRCKKVCKKKNENLLSI